MCHDPAMTVESLNPAGGSPGRHEVAVLALPRTIAFELGLPHRLPRRRPSTPRAARSTASGSPPSTAAPVRTSAGYAVLPDHDASLLETAHTVVVPGVYGGPAWPTGGCPPTSPRRCAGGRATLGSSPSAPARSCSPPPGCSTAARPPRTGCTPPRSARLFPAGRAWTPTCSSSTTATCSPRPGNAAGIDLLLHLVRRDHGSEVANARGPPQRGRAVAGRRPVAVHRAAGARARRHRHGGHPRLGGRARLAEPLTLAELAAHARMSVRTFTRRFREETGISAAAVADRSSGSRWPGSCWSRPTPRSTGSPPRRGSAPPASLRQHLHAAIGVAPLTYRRTFRGGRPDVTRSLTPLWRRHPIPAQRVWLR